MGKIYDERYGLYLKGRERVTAFCQANQIKPPRIVESDDPQNFAQCAYYRDGVIYIHVPSCAQIGRAGRQWSYPGYSVDRTPFGVLAHELGHHVDSGVSVQATLHSLATAPTTTSGSPRCSGCM